MITEMKIMVVLTIKNYKQMKTTILTSIILLTVVFAAGQNIRIGANMVVTPGTKLHSNSDLIVENGELELQAGATLIMGNGRTLTVNNGGIINMPGIASEQAVVTSTGYFMFVVNGGGTLGAQHAVFEKMSGAGVTISPGAYIDPAGAFGNCVFRDGSPGGTLLTVNNNQDVTLYNFDFPENTWGGQYNVAKTVDLGNITFIDPTGAFAGAAYELDNYNRIHWPLELFYSDITVFLEGPWSNTETEMHTALRDAGLLPLSQPFDVWPWNYTGTESVTSIPADVVDWILLDLRDAPSPDLATSSTRMEMKAGFLKKDGSIVDLDGVSLLQFNQSVTSGLFAVIWHRNHLGVMSATALPKSADTYAYDFSQGIMQAYGGAAGYKEVMPGLAVMVAGDGNADGMVSMTDKDNLWTPHAGKTGYIKGDFNMDGQVDNTDKNSFWLPNYITGYSGMIPE
jgi:hypothetical protein